MLIERMPSLQELKSAKMTKDVMAANELIVAVFEDNLAKSQEIEELKTAVKNLTEKIAAISDGGAKS